LGADEVIKTKGKITSENTGGATGREILEELSGKVPVRSLSPSGSLETEVVEDSNQ
jgi:hypothetical protein